MPTSQQQGSRFDGDTVNVFSWDTTQRQQYDVLMKLRPAI
jgi:hypothetical protein